MNQQPLKAPVAPQSPAKQDGDQRAKEADCYSFKQLVQLEDKWLENRNRVEGERSSPDPIHEVPGSDEPTAIDEPCVVFTNRDRFGLALSGGGIRSASFNLGLLQALGAKGVLEHADYLSTVSGGGYIGGFWSALRKRRGDLAAARKKNASSAPTGASAGGAALNTPEDIDDPSQVPPALRGGNASLPESRELRHLREFSRFLMPRVGFVYEETWTGIVAVLGGMVPSLLATTVVLSACIALWLAVAGFLYLGPVLGAVGLFAGSTLLVHWGAEWFWHSSGKAGPEAAVGPWGEVGGFVAAAASGALWHWFRTSHLSLLAMPVATFSDPWLVNLLLRVEGLELLYPAAAWAAVGVGALFIRALSSRWRLASRAADRAAGRCFGVARTLTRALSAPDPAAGASTLQAAARANAASQRAQELLSEANPGLHPAKNPT